MLTVDPTQPMLDPRVGALATPGVAQPGTTPLADPSAALEAPPVMQPDGSATLELPGAAPADPQRFDANLAETIEEHELSKMAERLFFELDQDKTARDKRNERYAKAIQEANLDPDRPGPDKAGAPFDGASIVGHPVLIEASIDFAAAAIKELYPVSGPVRMHIPGTVAKETEARAKRKRDFLNWQLNESIKYRPQLEILLSQLPFEGTQYIKGWRDPALGRIRLDYVPVDDVLLAYSANNVYDSPRITHVQRLTKYTLRDRVDAGFYRDVASTGALTPEKTPAQEKVEQLQGKEDPGMNLDEERTVYEVSCLLEGIDDMAGERPAPYLATIDATTRKVLALYRNWEPDDQLKERLHWLIEFPFVPWRGSPLGLYQIVGSLSIAARGSLRALLDSAHVNNFPGGVSLKGGNTTGQSIIVNPMEIKPLEAPANIDDIRKLAMPFPFNPPSNVLFQLLGWLTEAAKGVVTTAEEKIADASNTMPVGTTLALIEQGSKVFSAVHARLHGAQHCVLKLVCFLNKLHPPIDEAKRANIELAPDDFADNEDMVPVSDPNVFSEAQRYAQLQATMQLSQDQRVQYDAYELHRRALEMLKIPNPDAILPPPKKPQPLNPAAENVQLSAGQPAIAFPDQDHAGHLETHLRYYADPYLGGSTLFLSQFVPVLVEHVKQHLSMMYGKEMNDTLEKALGAPLDQVMQSQDPQMLLKLDKLAALASASVHVTMKQRLEPIAPIIDHLYQVAQALAEPKIEDPRVLATKVAAADVARRHDADQRSAALAAQKHDDDMYQREADRTSKEVTDAAKLDANAVQYLLDLASSTDQNLREHTLAVHQALNPPAPKAVH